MNKENIITLDDKHIYVFTKDVCQQCKAVKRSLTKALGDYADHLVKYVNVDHDDAARDFIVSRGHLQAPVVYFRDTNFVGFRPDEIKDVAKEALSVSV